MHCTAKCSCMHSSHHGHHGHTGYSSCCSGHHHINRVPEKETQISRLEEYLNELKEDIQRLEKHIKEIEVEKE